ncbi:hypothetical protein A3E17_04190 [Candidatus Amesbacteria bacterium RIFCSPHIGHO2_12_FULL_48_14]|uniref:Uncharacterized protein n=1 Tax=Candidatus Amesbacteria bacterium RIFCSPHIGHO2_12_FULL_48_14 TaxID=1797257 RepID=A0A1F4Z7E5_9BACT|nr:MAG: hypothetical protein A3E17_04190 [Candidatus Amesbacteria bacterium RIFCSPHIGHO2_12_FULL_48_14]
MFGFLFKIIIVALVVIGLYSVVSVRRGSPPQIPSLSQITSAAQATFSRQAFSGLKNIDTSNLGKNLSQALDSLVTHPDRNSPVVLGVKITNDSLNTVVNVIQGLPPDQVDQIKNLLCSPATSSANE